MGSFTGEVIDAQKASDIGLVNAMVENGRLVDTARELAGRIASKPSEALRLAKRLLYAGQESTLS